jgi:hypothetical protein
MPKSHARYAPEYRRRMVELVRGPGKSRVTRVDFERFSELCETVGLDGG